MSDTLDPVKNPMLRCGFLCCIILRLLSPLGALPHAFSGSVLSLCWLYLPDLLYILKMLNQFIWQISGLTSYSLLWKKKSRFQVPHILVSLFASKIIYGGTEQISTEIQFLSVFFISEGQKFLWFSPKGPPKLTNIKHWISLLNSEISLEHIVRSSHVFSTQYWITPLYINNSLKKILRT